MGLAQHRKGGIHSHGRNGLPARSCHGKDAVFDFLIGIPESLLHTLPLLGAKLRHPFIGNLQIMEIHQIPVQPFPVGLP